MKLLRRLKNYPAKLKRLMDLAPLADDLHGAWQEREERPLTQHERELLENAMALSEVTAEDVCVPRSDIVALPNNAKLNDVLKAFGETYFSRLPVYGRDLDDIKGFISLKDILPFLGDSKENFVLTEHIRQVPFVPENMQVPRILNQMRRHKVSLVMVLDEFGGTSGLVVLKDILEELVGQMEDEHEDQSSSEDMDKDVVQTTPGVYRVRGTMMLEELEELLHFEMPKDLDDEVDTLAGWLQVVTQRIPGKGEKVMLGEQVIATVTGATPRQILWVEVQKKV